MKGNKKNNSPGPSASATEMTKISERLATLTRQMDRMLAPGIVDLPLQGGGTWGVNPTFAMSVSSVSPSVTEVVVAGKGPRNVALSYDDCLAVLRGET